MTLHIHLEMFCFSNLSPFLVLCWRRMDMDNFRHRSEIVVLNLCCCVVLFFPWCFFVNTRCFLWPVRREQLPSFSLGSEPRLCIGIVDFKITELFPDSLSLSVSWLSQPAASSSIFPKKDDRLLTGVTCRECCSCVSSVGWISCMQVSLTSKLFGVVRECAAQC